MSGLLPPDVDQEMGCCSCLGFLRKHDKSTESMLADQFSRDCMLDGLSDGFDSLTCGSNGKLTSFPSKNRPICREVPVKECSIVVHGEDSDGRKTINEYVRQRKIASGSYGKVVLYQSNIDGKPYAIKTFYKSRLLRVRVSPTETAMTDVLREISIMKTLEHPNIINLIEVIDDPESDHLYMVLEYVEGKCICDPSGSPGGIGESVSRRYLKDIIAGLLYLHSHNIVHGDIKPENLLVTKDGRVKIGDFSVSKAFEDDNDEIGRSPGTPVFTAPECCVGLTYHGKTADTWALGVTLYCMVLGYCPFIGDCLQDTYEKIVNSPLNLPEELDPQLKDLLRGLLCKDPKRRFLLTGAAEHPWVIREGEPVAYSICRCRSGPVEETSLR